MKRFLRIFAVVFFVALTISWPSHANVNDFVISSFDATYTLDRDDEGRSTLLISERITATFPDIDQNHGIERALPLAYDGHPTSLKILSVQDGNGESRQYTTYESNGNLVVRIGDPNAYAHGSQVYQIIYTQRDVTKYFADSDSDEWYWDINGVGWSVPISELHARFKFSERVAEMSNGEQACYRGASGSTDRCAIEERSDGSWHVSVYSLEPTENVTVAFGFKPNSFSEYQPTFLEQVLQVWIALNVFSAPIAIIVTIWLVFRWFRARNRTRETGTIVTEYLPPKDTSVTVSAEVIDSPKSVITAQLLDLAVRHYIKIIQTKEKSFFHAAEYEIEIIRDLSTLHDEEKEIVTDMFNKRTAVGSKLPLKSLRSDYTFRVRLMDNTQKLTKLMRGAYGLRDRSVSARKLFRVSGLVILVSAFLLLSVPLAIAAVVAFILSWSLWPLTDRGLELRRYLAGLKRYIKVAEVDRINMLQSPEGAAKVGESVDPHNTRQLIKLYERVLPYAVLFGQEKQWASELGAYYESASERPDWYSGSSTVFNAVVFSAALDGFVNSAATYAAGSSSSSSGAGGGGSSGGGGGGGGGGGW